MKGGMGTGRECLFCERVKEGALSYWENEEANGKLGTIEEN